MEEISNQTTLTNPWGVSTFTYGASGYAIYAVWEADEEPSAGGGDSTYITTWED